MANQPFKRIFSENQDQKSVPIDQDQEIWKDIKDFPGYQVSNMGRVRSFRKGGGDRKPKLTNSVQAMLKPLKEPAGNKSNPRLSLMMRHKSGQMLRRRVHRLVLEMFIGPCPPGMEGCHNDGNPLNNHLSNLRYDTHHNNILDKIKHGTILKGEDNPVSKLTEQQVLQIRTQYSSGATVQSLAQEFHIHIETIRYLIKGHTWKHVGGSVSKPGEAESRHPRQGSKNARALLDETQVSIIKQKLNNGENYINLANEFQVKIHVIKFIAYGKTWKHVQ